MPVIVISVTLLTVSLLAASVGYYYGGQANAANLEQTHRVVLHIRKADREQFYQAIAYAENFVGEHDAKDQIEVVAHGKAVDLMRVGVSPFEGEIAGLISHHPNVHFVACTGPGFFYFGKRVA